MEQRICIFVLAAVAFVRVAGLVADDILVVDADWHRRGARMTLGRT